MWKFIPRANLPWDPIHIHVQRVDGRRTLRNFYCTVQYTSTYSSVAAASVRFHACTAPYYSRYLNAILFASLCVIIWCARLLASHGSSDAAGSVRALWSLRGTCLACAITSPDTRVSTSPTRFCTVPCSIVARCLDTVTWWFVCLLACPVAHFWIG